MADSNLGSASGHLHSSDSNQNMRHTEIVDNCAGELIQKNALHDIRVV